jgi:2-phospho-L-lactate guanylyltransferase
MGASSVLVIHSDLPLFNPREIERFLTLSKGYSVVLTPSKDRDGTNVLLIRPPSAIRPAFGKDSFHKHLRLARRENVRSKVLIFKGMGFDVDTPRDLVHLIGIPLRNETGRFLRAFRQQS